MNMTSKNEINFVLNKPGLKHHPHALSFHVVVVNTVIPRRVKENDQPWSLCSVYFLEFLFKPIILWSVFT